MEEKIVLVLNEMSEYLTIPQMKKLQEVIIKNFAENEGEKRNIFRNSSFGISVFATSFSAKVLIITSCNFFI